MENNNCELLKKVSEDDIQLICKTIDLDLLLMPMRKGKDKYKKYIKALKSLNKKSSVVRTLLPKYAFDLYHKGDQAYAKVMNNALQNFVTNFNKVISEYIEPVVTIDEITKFSVDEYVSLYLKMNEKVDEFTVEVFFLALKLNDICLNEKTISDISNKISLLMKIKELEKEYDKRLKNEVTEAERELSQHYEHEKNRITKNCNQIKNELKENQQKVGELIKKLEEYEKREQDEKVKLVDSWKKEVDKELLEKRKKAENALENEIQEIRQSALVQFKEEEEISRKRLEDEQKTNEKEFLIKIAKLKSEIEELEEKKEQLEGMIVELSSTESILQESIDSLQKTEEKYFKNLKQRVLERKLDNIVFESSDSSCFLEVAQAQLINASRIPSIHKMQSIYASTEESVKIDKMADFIQDFGDNLAINFEDSTEMAAIVVAAMFNNKAIVVEDSIAQYVVESFSELIDGDIPIVVEANDANAKGIISVINNSDKKVIYIVGILDKFDEITFSHICRECCANKFIFFGIPKISDVEMFSKNIVNYAIILDAEDSVIFAKEEPILIGKHNINEYKENYELVKCRKYYDKHFRNLVSNAVITQKAALDLTKILYIYFDTMSGLGQVIKKSIRFYWESTNMEQDELDMLLEKAGWK